MARGESEAIALALQEKARLVAIECAGSAFDAGQARALQEFDPRRCEDAKRKLEERPGPRP